MKRFMIFTILAICGSACVLSANGQTTSSASKMTSEEFLTKMTGGIKAYAQENSEVVNLGQGTCRILSSGKPSKAVLKGEGEGIELVYPTSKLLSQVMASEKKRPQPSKSRTAVWIAWRDHEGRANIAFNALMDSYEISTIWEVKNPNDDRWQAWNTYAISQIDGFQQGKPSWVIMDRASFCWLRLGQIDKEASIGQFTKSLTGIQIISDVKVAQ